MEDNYGKGIRALLLYREVEYTTSSPLHADVIQYFASPPPLPRNLK